MLGKIRHKLRLETKDEVYLKDSFERYFTKKTGLLFRKEMNALCGQRVIVSSTIKTYHENSDPTYSFVATSVNGLKHCERLPLECIDRGKPLIRNGRKYSLINKDLYIQII